MSLTESLQAFAEAYPSLPVEAVVKQDVLRRGIHASPDALEDEANYKSKDYFIFSFDHVSLDDHQSPLRMPEEIRLSGGGFNLRPTVVSVRFDPQSPYRIAMKDNKRVLLAEEEKLCDVEFSPMPAQYAAPLSGGYQMREIAPVMEWGYLIYLTVFRRCQYWDSGSQCRYCDIGGNYDQQKRAGRAYTRVKSVDIVLEALRKTAEHDSVAGAYTLTGGSVTSSLEGKNEADFYLGYIEAIENAFPRRWTSKAVVQAPEKKDCVRYKNAGLQILHPNLEVWDSELFARLCPGKSSYIGREEWLRRIFDAADIFGAELVIPNFVGGVEMAQPFGFKTVEEAVKSTAEGFEELMCRGILPRFTTWCPEPHSALGVQEAPPLDYFLKLLERYRELFEKYSLAVPLGYGSAGPGRAVFSVSAFMDCLS